MDGHLTDYLDVLSMTTVASNLQPVLRSRRRAVRLNVTLWLLNGYGLSG
jgi:sRNA-binding regulator protein Hfq